MSFPVSSNEANQISQGRRREERDGGLFARDDARRLDLLAEAGKLANRLFVPVRRVHVGPVQVVVGKGRQHIDRPSRSPSREPSLLCGRGFGEVTNRRSSSDGSRVVTTPKRSRNVDPLQADAFSDSESLNSYL